MKKIRVTVGTVGMYDENHAHTRKSAADGAFSCEDEQADYFVAAGVAESVTENAAQPEQSKAPADTQQEAANDQKAAGHLDEAQLYDMTIPQLQSLAGDLGIDVTRCKKKADYVTAIAAVEVTPGPEADEDDMPVLGAADPE